MGGGPNRPVSKSLRLGRVKFLLLLLLRILLLLLLLILARSKQEDSSRSNVCVVVYVLVTINSMTTGTCASISGAAILEIENWNNSKLHQQLRGFKTLRYAERDAMPHSLGCETAVPTA